MTVARVDLETGEIVAAISPDDARALTDRIRDSVEATWALLLEAHEQKAWAALGYSSWADYVRAEFDMGRQYSYRLLDQGRVIRAIEEATSRVTHGSHGAVSPMGDISEREARQIKPHLDEVTGEIRDRISSTPSLPSPERTRQIVREVIDNHRDQIADARIERDANDAWIRDVNAQAPEGFDPAENSRRLRLVGSLRRNTTDIAALPDPHDIVAGLMEHQFNISEPVQAAIAWLTRFCDELDDRNGGGAHE